MMCLRKLCMQFTALELSWFQRLNFSKGNLCQLVYQTCWRLYHLLKKTFPENFCNMEIGLIVKRGLVDRFLIRHQSATITCKWKTDQAGPTKQDSFMYKWSQNEKSLLRLRDRIWIFDSLFLGLTPGLPNFQDNFLNFLDNFPNSFLLSEFAFTFRIFA